MTIEVIMSEVKAHQAQLYQQPAWIKRFPAMNAMIQAGLTPISPTDYMTIDLPYLLEQRLQPAAPAATPAGAAPQRGKPLALVGCVEGGLTEKGCWRGRAGSWEGGKERARSRPFFPLSPAGPDVLSGGCCS